MFVESPEGVSTTEADVQQQLVVSRMGIQALFGSLQQLLIAGDSSKGGTAKQLTLLNELWHAHHQSHKQGALDRAVAAVVRQDLQTTPPDSGLAADAGTHTVQQQQCSEGSERLSLSQQALTWRAVFTWASRCRTGRENTLRRETMNKCRTVLSAKLIVLAQQRWRSYWTQLLQVQLFYSWKIIADDSKAQHAASLLLSLSAAIEASSAAASEASESRELAQDAHSGASVAAVVFLTHAQQAASVLALYTARVLLESCVVEWSRSAAQAFGCAAQASAFLEHAQFSALSHTLLSLLQRTQSHGLRHCCRVWAESSAKCAVLRRGTEQSEADREAMRREMEEALAAKDAELEAGKEALRREMEEALAAIEADKEALTDALDTALAAKDAELAALGQGNEQSEADREALRKTMEESLAAKDAELAALIQIHDQCEAEKEALRKEMEDSLAAKDAELAEHEELAMDNHQGQAAYVLLSLLQQDQTELLHNCFHAWLRNAAAELWWHESTDMTFTSECITQKAENVNNKHSAFVLLYVARDYFIRLRYMFFHSWNRNAAEAIHRMQCSLTFVKHSQIAAVSLELLRVSATLQYRVQCWALNSRQIPYERYFLCHAQHAACAYMQQQVGFEICECYKQWRWNADKARLEYQLNRLQLANCELAESEIYWIQRHNHAFVQHAQSTFWRLSLQQLQQNLASCCHLWMLNMLHARLVEQRRLSFVSHAQLAVDAVCTHVEKSSLYLGWFIWSRNVTEAIAFRRFRRVMYLHTLRMCIRSWQEVEPELPEPMMAPLQEDYFIARDMANKIRGQRNFHNFEIHEMQYGMQHGMQIPSVGIRGIHNVHSPVHAKQQMPRHSPIRHPVMHDSDARQDRLHALDRDLSPNSRRLRDEQLKEMSMRLNAEARLVAELELSSPPMQQYRKPTTRRSSYLEADKQDQRRMLGIGCEREVGQSQSSRGGFNWLPDPEEIW